MLINCITFSKSFVYFDIDIETKVDLKVSKDIARDAYRLSNFVSRMLTGQILFMISINSKTDLRLPWDNSVAKSQLIFFTQNKIPS